MIYLFATNLGQNILSTICFLLLKLLHGVYILIITLHTANISSHCFNRLFIGFIYLLGCLIKLIPCACSLSKFRCFSCLVVLSIRR